MGKNARQKAACNKLPDILATIRDIYDDSMTAG
jgi:hypothetical protein